MFLRLDTLFVNNTALSLKPSLTLQLHRILSGNPLPMAIPNDLFVNQTGVKVTANPCSGPLNCSSYNSECIFIAFQVSAEFVAYSQFPSAPRSAEIIRSARPHLNRFLETRHVHVSPDTN